VTTVEERGRAAARDRARELAVADALVSIGRALTLLGSRLSDIHDEDTRDAAVATIEQSTTGADVPRGGLGPRQLTVLALGGFDSPAGLSSGDVETRQAAEPVVVLRWTADGHRRQAPAQRAVVQGVPTTASSCSFS
jgi:hypothetical protein